MNQQLKPLMGRGNKIADEIRIRIIGKYSSLILLPLLPSPLWRDGFQGTSFDDPSIQTELLPLMFFACGYLFSRFFDRSRKVGVKGLDLLSLREREILSLVSKHKSNKEIATQLGIETSTVKCHINNLYKKLDVMNRNEAFTVARILNDKKIL